MDLIRRVSSFSPISYGLTLLSLLIAVILLGILQVHKSYTKQVSPEGCRRIGLQGRSNLADHQDLRYSSGSNPGISLDGTPLWRVKALFIYPIKSCRRIELDHGEIIRTGMKYDRQFCFAQQVTSLPSSEENKDGSHTVKSEWNFITQRTFARMAKVETEMWIPDPSSPTYSPNAEFVKSDGCIVMRFPFSPDVDLSWSGVKALASLIAAKLYGQSEPMVEQCIPFNPSLDRIKEKGYTSEKMKIWKDAPEALNMGAEMPEDVMAKLKYSLGVTNPLTLFRIDTQKYREVFKCAPKKQDVGYQIIIGMADSYPLHIMNLASVHDVASKIPKGYYKEFNPLRYRANVYITGPPAFAEDSWAKARIGDCNYHISCRTTRCKLPNVDPETAIRDRVEPEKTMRSYRVVDKGSSSACLGMQVTPLVEETGEISVGDEVKLLEQGEHFFLKV
ncbi:MOSC-domain-containing protein [Mytilinidion resinicola]|uniref:MOSC-domain-containing protein n=1 Tax=Mytilinidion resinicola TaxID=574789 RepID=A0A6A6YBV3_9PEZI|nr:MOSC-domain-containing protein [Mytilinidion resinicola]KAF2805575.1 MOSC-domain-containing protein [Mytilinidion resinicola]